MRASGLYLAIQHHPNVATPGSSRLATRRTGDDPGVATHRRRSRRRNAPATIWIVISASRPVSRRSRRRDAPATIQASRHTGVLVMDFVGVLCVNLNVFSLLPEKSWVALIPLDQKRSTSCCYSRIWSAYTEWFHGMSGIR
nr:hypothetical protein CFP56_52956 [Quercus suber]